MRLVTALLVSLSCVACGGLASAQKGYQWTKFVPVEGQPDPVPAEWVSTPEGKLAHSIKLPNPLPKDSGYRDGMDSKEYFEHLCKTEAGEFIYKTVDNVEGFYFARPPKWPSDDDLKDRYKLEAPEIERSFQLLEAKPAARAVFFVSPPWRLYSYVEEPAIGLEFRLPYVRSSGYRNRYRKDASQMLVEEVAKLNSRFGMTWRGIRRQHDRESSIAGSEWIIFDMNTKDVISVQRNFARTGFTKNTSEGIYWLNALGCSAFRQNNLPTRFYEFATKSLHPSLGATK